MFKKLLLLVVLASLSVPVFAQSVDTAWVRRYNGPGNSYDAAKAVAVGGSGNVYVTGCSYSSGTGYDYATVRYSSAGDTVWVRRYNGPGNDYDEPYAIAVDDSDNVYVTGVSNGGATDEDYATIKYYPNGDTAWVRRYNGPGNGDDYAGSIAVDDSGNVCVTGYSYSGVTFNDYATIKYYADGDLAWVRRYNGTGNFHDEAHVIDVDSSGNIYVAGRSWGDGTSFDYTTIKYYPNGDTAWLRRYNGIGSGGDDVRAIEVDSPGNVYVTGYSSGIGTYYDYATIKYNSNGDTAWVRRYNGPSYDYDLAHALAVDSSGNVYVTGRSWGSGTSDDYSTVKYYPDGDTAWVRRYDGPGNFTDEALSLAVDASGRVYVTGYSSQSGSSPFNLDYATLKYDSDGTTAWVKRYNGSADDDDYAQALVLDDSGNLYVTGRSLGSGADYDYATIKYVQFLRGDTNGDRNVSLSDIVYLISYLFRQGPSPDPIQKGDTNCDGNVSLSDIVYLISYLFKQGAPPCI